MTAVDPHSAPTATTGLQPAATDLAQMVLRLERHYQGVLDGPMRGLPLVHPWLRVQAVGFQWAQDANSRVAEGLLITPWCMNLVRVPERPPAGARTGQRLTRAFGIDRFDFIGAIVEGWGWIETCHLFSPMSDFADHDQALDTARAVLDLLRPPPSAKPHPPTPTAEGVDVNRRRWLFGRSPSAGARP